MVRVFATIVQCIGRIGKELFFEANAAGVVLRALNDAKSAFISFNLMPEYFATYAGPDVGNSIKCKLFVKNCQHAFRNLRHVDSMRLYFDTASGRTHFLVVEHSCRRGVMKKHSLIFEECEILQAVFDRSTAPNCVAFRPQLFTTLLQYIKGSAEVTFAVANDLLEVASFHQNLDDTVARSLVKTSMTVNRNEFDHFHLDEEYDQGSDVTFSLKEFRALLQFCEAAAVSEEQLYMYFFTHGVPLLFTTEGTGNPAFFVSLILATVHPDHPIAPPTQGPAHDRRTGTPSVASSQAEPPHSTYAATPAVAPDTAINVEDTAPADHDVSVARRGLGGTATARPSLYSDSSSSDEEGRGRTGHASGLRTADFESVAGSQFEVR